MNLKTILAKIKNPFQKEEKTNKIPYILGAIFVLLVFASSAYLIYENHYSSDFMINYLPNDMMAFEHCPNLESNSEASEILFSQLKYYFKIDERDREIFSLFKKQGGAVFFIHRKKEIPIFIFEVSEDTPIATIKNWARKENIIFESLSEKLIILAKDSTMLANLKVNSFQNKKNLRKFIRKNNPLLSFYLNLDKLRQTKNLKTVDKSILSNLIASNRRQIFLSITNKNGYALQAEDINNTPIFSSKILAKPNKENLNHFFATNLDINGEKAILATQIHNYNELPINKIAEILPPIDEMEIILFNNPNKATTSPKNIKFHDRLLLNGENAAYHYILIFKNSLQNKKSLEQIKLAFINYLDSQIPQEKITKLPDGTLMTELWSNPERFSFKNKKMKNFSLSYLANEDMNFEISYIEKDNFIFLGNSKKLLSEFVKNASINKNPQDNGIDYFFIDINASADNSFVLNMLKNLGNSIIGEVNF